MLGRFLYAYFALVECDRITPVYAIRAQDRKHSSRTKDLAEAPTATFHYLTPESVSSLNTKRYEVPVVKHADIPFSELTPHSNRNTVSNDGDANLQRGIMATVHAGHLGGLGKDMPDTDTHAYIAYPAVGSIVVAIIVFLYWPRGKRVIFSVLAYLMFLSSMKLTVKYIFSVYAFNFPKFVCTVHFFLGYLAAMCILVHRGSNQQRLGGNTYQGVFSAVAKPSFKTFWLQIFPISLGFATAIAANNMALVFSSAAFTEIIGCTSPIFAFLLMACTGMKVNPWLLVPVVLVILGCGVSVTGEMHFSTAGMVLCCISNLGRAVKCTLQQVVLTEESKDALDPVNLLAWMCLPSMAIMGAWSALAEGVHPLLALGAAEQRFGIWKWLIISGINATGLNLAQIFVTKEIGALGSQLTAQAKSVLTMLGGMVFLHEMVTPMEWAGFVVVLFGVYLYTRWDKKE